MYQGDTRNAHDKQTILNLHQDDTRVNTHTTQNPKTRFFRMTAIIFN